MAIGGRDHAGLSSSSDHRSTTLAVDRQTFNMTVLRILGCDDLVAGIMAPLRRQVTPDGLEVQFQVKGLFDLQACLS